MIFILFILQFQACNNTSKQETEESSEAKNESIIPENGTFLSTDEMDIFYQIKGNAKDTIIIIHGGPGMDSEYMVADFKELSEEYTLIFYDQRGGGRSSLPDTTKNLENLLSIDKHVEDLEALRNYFGMKKVNLIAHSFGPALAVNYALTYPSKVESMVFIGPVPPYIGDFFERYIDSMKSRLSDKELHALDSLEKEMIYGEDPVSACNEYWKIGLKPRIAKGLSIDVIKGNCCAAPPDAIRYGYLHTGNVTFGSLGQWDYRPQLKEINVPTLVIHGEEESIPMDMVEAWVEEGIPGSKLVKIGGAAHFPYAEKPQEVWGAIRDFYSEM
ncbi:MAG: alpha/beta fold hydrolase, partial [Cyclobacteriaceae bacterium]|nr:alpha/beta fold hydrolase [Cyclobacteriaceae bacterium]